MEGASAGDFEKIDAEFPPDVDLGRINRKDEDGRTALVDYLSIASCLTHKS
jgi:hypothetical protein